MKPQLAQIERSIGWMAAGLFAASLSLAVGFFVTGCAPGGGSQAPAAKAKSTDEFSHLSAEEKIDMAEVMVEEAEERISLATVPEIYGEMVKASRLDPDNRRAQFWLHVLAPLNEIKGIIARIRPLYLKEPKGLERYERLLQTFEREQSPQYVEFMTKGLSNIDTEEKVREVLERATVHLDALRVFIRKNKDRELVIRMPYSFLESLPDSVTGVGTGRNIKSEDHCGTELARLQKNTGACLGSRMLSLKFGRADFELLQTGVTYYTAFLVLASSYRINPLRVFEYNARTTVPDRHNVERTLTGFDGSILPGQKLSLFEEMAADTAIALRMLEKSQDEFCGRKKYRPGYFLTQGICFRDDFQADQNRRNIQIFEAFVAGEPIAAELDELRARNVEVAFDFKKLMKQPPSSLQPFKPLEYDSKDRATKFNESAFTPYLVKGTFKEYTDANIERQDREERETKERERIPNPWQVRSQSTIPLRSQDQTADEYPDPTEPAESETSPAPVPATPSRPLEAI